MEFFPVMERIELLYFTSTTALWDMCYRQYSNEQKLYVLSIALDTLAQMQLVLESEYLKIRNETRSLPINHPETSNSENEKGKKHITESS